MWDARTGTLLLGLDGGIASSVAFDPSGGGVLVAHGSGKAEAMGPGSTRPFYEIKGNPSGVIKTSFSPDGGRILIGQSDGAAKIFDVRTGTELLELKGQARSRATCYSPGTAHVWSLPVQTRSKSGTDGRSRLPWN